MNMVADARHHPPMPAIILPASDSKGPLNNALTVLTDAGPVTLMLST